MTEALKGKFLLAGFQDKIAAFILPGQRIGLPKEGFDAPTTHILKISPPDSVNAAFNEHLCLFLAAACGCNVPPSGILNFEKEKVFIIERYDRKIINNRLSRLHQEDLCQLLGLSRDRKYQRNRNQAPGPGFKEMLEIFQKLEDQNRLNSTLKPWKTELLNLSIFNFAIGNKDAHGKNFSLIYDENFQLNLAPAYDLLTMTPYNLMDQTHTMSYSQSRETGLNVPPSRDDWLNFAQTFSVSSSEICKAIAKISETILDNLENQVEKCCTSNGCEKKTAEILTKAITKTANRLRKTGLSLSRNTHWAPQTS